MREIDRNLL
jgi:hypothetical protein